MSAWQPHVTEAPYVLGAVAPQGSALQTCLPWKMPCLTPHHCQAAEMTYHTADSDGGEGRMGPLPRV